MRDAALIVMGGIVGSGIFVNPSVVARLVHTPFLVMLAWVIGGIIAIIGAGVFAELAARRPHDGGVYAYLRDAYHPVVAFCYGWTLLLVSQSGGSAASAVTFAFYLPAITGITLTQPQATGVAVFVIAVFTIVNCLGVRESTTTQNGFMLAKIVAIGAVIGAALFAFHGIGTQHAAPVVPPSFNPAVAIGLALVPVMFAYSGWQTSSFMAGEMRDSNRSLPLGMLHRRARRHRALPRHECGLPARSRRGATRPHQHARLRYRARRHRSGGREGDGGASSRSRRSASSPIKS